MQALLQSSHMYHEAKERFAKHGIMATGVQVDLGTMMKQKDDAVEGLTSGIEGLFKKNKVRHLLPYVAGCSCSHLAHLRPVSRRRPASFCSTEYQIYGAQFYERRIVLLADALGCVVFGT